MQKRLISQNIIQCTNQSSPQFAAFGSFIAFKTDSCIRVKTCNKDVRELDIKGQGGQGDGKGQGKYFFFAYEGGLFFVSQSEGGLEVWEIQVAGGEIKGNMVQRLANAKNAVALKSGLAYISQQKVAKLFNPKTKTHTPICNSPENSTILAHEGQQIFILSPTETDTKVLRIYTKTSINYEESPLNIDYIRAPLAIFRDQFVFQDNKGSKEIEIYNIGVSKIVGKFGYEGDLVKVVLKGTILLVITSKQNMDKYYFYTLNSDPTSKSILSHRSVYEKGKGSHYQAFNCAQQIGEQIIQGKATNVSKEIEEVGPNANQVLLIYVQPAKKTKIEIMRVSNVKIKDQAFRENELDKIVLSKTEIKEKGVSQKKLKSEKEMLEIEKARVGVSMSHRKSQKSVQELQKAIIDHVVDIKIKGIMDKFEVIQRRLNSIEDQIVLIYQKIERSLQKINREEIKKNVENIFDRVTPQFESYFKQVFRQISGVMDQGVNYYTMKLAKESEVHRDAFNQIINMTFDAAQEITELGRKELEHSEKTSENVEKLLMIKKKWETQVGQLSETFKGGAGKSGGEGNHCEIKLGQPLSPDKKPTTSPQNVKKKN